MCNGLNMRHWYLRPTWYQNYTQLPHGNLQARPLGGHLSLSHGRLFIDVSCARNSFVRGNFWAHIIEQSKWRGWRIILIVECTHVYCATSRESSAPYIFLKNKRKTWKKLVSRGKLFSEKYYASQNELCWVIMTYTAFNSYKKNEYNQYNQE